MPGDNIMCITLGRKNRVKRVSRTVEEKLGYRPGELKDHDFLDILANDSKVILNEVLTGLKSESLIRTDEMKLKKKNGDVLYIDAIFSVVGENSKKRLHITIRDITDKRLMTRCIVHQREIIANVKKIIDIVTMNISIDKKLQYLIETITKSVKPADIGMIFKFDKRINGLRLVASYGYTKPELLKDVNLRVGEGLTGKIFESEKPLMLIAHEKIMDLMKDIAPAKAEQINKALEGLSKNVKSVIGVPIKFDGKTIGVLLLDSFSKTEIFNGESLEIMELFSKCIGVVLSRDEV